MTAKRREELERSWQTLVQEEEREIIRRKIRDKRKDRRNERQDQRVQEQGHN